MKKLVAPPDCVLVKIDKERRRKLFEKDIVTDKGEVISLITQLEYEAGCAECGLQTVGSAEVVDVGRDVPHLVPGDMVMMEYTVEMNKSQKLNVIDETADYYCVRGITTYHESDFSTGANRTGSPLFVWRAGEIDILSPIIAIVRGDRVISLDPYLLLQYEEIKKNVIVNVEGKVEEDPYQKTLERMLVADCPHVDNVHAGDVLIVDDFDIYERTIDDRVFSVVFKHDVLAILHNH